MMRDWHPARLLPDIGGLFALVTFILLTLFSGGRSLNDGDTFWHIAAGQRMLADRAILTQDVFSHTAHNAPWTAHEWLSEIVMAIVHDFAGLPGVCIFFFFIASLSFWLLYVTVRQEASEWPTLVFVSLAFILSLSHLLARPHIFTWLLGGLSFYLLKKQNRSLYFLPVITILWVNLHGGFILGIALQGMFLCGRYIEAGFPLKKCHFINWLKEQKTSLLVFFLTIIAVGINPFGYSLYLFPFHVSGDVFAQGINEWLSPNLQEQWIFRFFLLFIIFLLSLNKSLPTWQERLFLLFFINAALVHQRHISVAGYYLAPVLARSTERWLTPVFHIFSRKKADFQAPLVLSKWSGPVGSLTLAIIFLVLSSSLLPKSQFYFKNLIPVPEKIFPIAAVEYLSTNRPKGNVLNQYAWGGYMIYALRPEQPVFIDGRADMYGLKIFGDYQKIVQVDEKMDELLEQYNIKWIFYPKDSPLIRYLKQKKNWQEIYADELASILTKGKDSRP